MRCRANVAMVAGRPERQLRTRSRICAVSISRTSFPLADRISTVGAPTCSVVEKGAKSRGSARRRQIRLLVLQNLWYEAVLPASDLLAESLAQERRSDGSAVE